MLQNPFAKISRITIAVLFACATMFLLAGCTAQASSHSPVDATPSAQSEGQPFAEKATETVRSLKAGTEAALIEQEATEDAADGSADEGTAAPQQGTVCPYCPSGRADCPHGYGPGSALGQCPSGYDCPNDASRPYYESHHLHGYGYGPNGSGTDADEGSGAGSAGGGNGSGYGPVSGSGHHGGHGRHHGNA